MVGIRTSARVNKDRLPTPIEPLLQEENGGEISQPEVERAPNYLFFESLLRPEIIRHEIGKREELLATLTDPTEIARQEVAIGAMKTFPNARLVIDRDDSRVPQIRKLIGLIHDDHQPRLKYATWAPYQAPHVQPHILLADSKTPFEIPLTNVVGASSFDSWEGRGYGGRNNKEIYENGTAVRMPSVHQKYHRLSM